MAHILIVDDSPTDLLHLRQTLMGAGHTVVAVQSGVEALAVVKAESPDAVLMDVVMPGLNGFAATRNMHRDPETAHIPIIVISSKDTEADRQWALRQGAREYLTKPVDKDDLLEVLESVLSA